MMKDVILGASHITDFSGLDHILFLVALAASFDLTKLGRMALLATAFTIGHSLTLILAGIDVVRAVMDMKHVEFLIPLTIVLTALLQISGLSLTSSSKFARKSIYVFTIFFGLIHGLGFSSFYRISTSGDSGFIIPLLKFNLGVEIGQLVILLVTLSLFSLGRALGIQERSQQLVVGGATLSLALMMAIENWSI